MAEIKRDHASDIEPIHVLRDSRRAASFEVTKMTKKWS